MNLLRNDEQVDQTSAGSHYIRTSFTLGKFACESHRGSRRSSRDDVAKSSESRNVSSGGRKSTPTVSDSTSESIAISLMLKEKNQSRNRDTTFTHTTILPRSTPLQTLYRTAALKRLAPSPPAPLHCPPPSSEGRYSSKYDSKTKSYYQSSLNDNERISRTTRTKNKSLSESSSVRCQEKANLDSPIEGLTNSLSRANSTQVASESSVGYVFQEESAIITVSSDQKEVTDRQGKKSIRTAENNDSLDSAGKKSIRSSKKNDSNDQPEDTIKDVVTRSNASTKNSDIDMVKAFPKSSGFKRETDIVTAIASRNSSGEKRPGSRGSNGEKTFRESSSSFKVVNLPSKEVDSVKLITSVDHHSTESQSMCCYGEGVEGVRQDVDVVDAVVEEGVTQDADIIDAVVEGLHQDAEVIDPVVEVVRQDTGVKEGIRQDADAALRKVVGNNPDSAFSLTSRVLSQGRDGSDSSLMSNGVSEDNRQESVTVPLISLPKAMIEEWLMGEVVEMEEEKEEMAKEWFRGKEEERGEEEEEMAEELEGGVEMAGKVEDGVEEISETNEISLAEVGGLEEMMVEVGVEGEILDEEGLDEGMMETETLEARNELMKEMCRQGERIDYVGVEMMGTEVVDSKEEEASNNEGNANNNNDDKARELTKTVQHSGGSYYNDNNNNNDEDGTKSARNSVPSRLPTMQERQRRISDSIRSKELGKVDVNLNATCTCANGDPKRLSDVLQKLGPSPRPSGENKKKNAAVGGDNDDDDDDDFGYGYNHGWDGDCPEDDSPWLWYRDAVWGCDEWEFDRDLERRRYKAYVAEYINSRGGGQLVGGAGGGATKQLIRKSVDGKIIYRQGGGENQEVLRINVRKSGQNFDVTWNHPSGSHPAYLLVVYPPMNAGGGGGGGADCGPCVADPECLCGTTPLFRRLLTGDVKGGKFPASILRSGKTYVIEVVTLDKENQESLGSSLVTFET